VGLAAADAVEFVKRGIAVQRRRIVVVDALGHVLEARQDEAFLGRGPADARSRELLLELRGFVADHLQSSRRFRVPLGVLGLEVLVHVLPLVLVATLHQEFELPVPAHARVRVSLRVIPSIGLQIL